jgi:hypothetical protein
LAVPFNARKCWRAKKNTELRLLFGSGGLGGGVGVFFGEAFDAACGVQKLLLASEKRMAIGANFDAEHIALYRRASGEIVPTCTVDGNCVIVGMNTGLH